MQFFTCTGHLLPNLKITIAHRIPITCVLVFLLSCVQTQAQDTAITQEAVPANGQSPFIIPDGGLQIGDPIPDELWNLPLQVVNHPDGKETITLADYKGKLIILDFWATWCAPCISSLDKLDSLQDQLDTTLAVVPTTFEDAKKVTSFVEKRGWSLPTAVSETSLKPYFPHRSVPHQIWIKDGKVRAITDHEKATIENITKMWEDDAFTLHAKKDILDYSPGMNLSLLANRVGVPVLFSSALTGQIEGIPTSIGRGFNGDTSLVFFTNVPVIYMYRDALGTTNNRLIVDLDTTASSMSDLFYGKDVFTYQLKCSKEVPMYKVNKWIVGDLNTAFDLRLDSHVVDMDCYVISDTGDAANDLESSSLQDGGTAKLIEYRLSGFVNLLNYTIPWTPQQPIYINECIKDIKIKTTTYNSLQKEPEKVRAALSSYGLNVKKEKRSIIMYVISNDQSS